VSAGPPGFALGPSPARPADADRTGRRVVALFRPYRGRVAVIAVTILVSSLLGLALPFLTQAIFDRALFPRTGDGIGPPRLGLLTTLVAISVAVTLVGAAISVGQTLPDDPARQRGDARPAGPPVQPPAAHGPGLLHPHPHR
jgi:ATP-binding cassette subfamily B protein